jgi:hypothetical protein
MYRKCTERVTWMYKYKYKYRYGVHGQGGCGLENDAMVIRQQFPLVPFQATVRIDKYSGPTARLKVSYVNGEGQLTTKDSDTLRPIFGPDSVIVHFRDNINPTIFVVAEVWKASSLSWEGVCQDTTADVTPCYKIFSNSCSRC